MLSLSKVGSHAGLLKRWLPLCIVLTTLQIYMPCCFAGFASHIMDSKSIVTDGSSLDEVSTQKAGEARFFTARRAITLIAIAVALAVVTVLGWYASETTLFKRSVVNMDHGVTYEDAGNGFCTVVDVSFPEGSASADTNSSHRDLNGCPYLKANSWGYATAEINIAKCLEFNKKRGCGNCCSVSSDGTYYNIYKKRWESNCYCGLAGYYDYIKKC